MNKEIEQLIAERDWLIEGISNAKKLNSLLYDKLSNLEDKYKSGVFTLKQAWYYNIEWQTYIDNNNKMIAIMNNQLKKLFHCEQCF